MSGVPHRCGVVALLGRPNSGKSTLLNALLGEKLAIISARAQTTRGRMLGVLTRPEAQLLFYDTPGVHRGQTRFNLAMTETAQRAAEDADLRVVLFDATAEWDSPEERLSELPAPILLVRTKIDLGPASRVHHPERWKAVLEVSAHSGSGLDALVEEIARHLPEGPALYPEDFITDAPWRFLAAEQVREVIFEQFHDEMPYVIAVEVEDWQEDEGGVRVRANLLVERDSQKGIAVGAGGRMLKVVGSEARRRLAERIGKDVHLNLWVKTDKNWSKRPRRVRQLGYL